MSELNYETIENGYNSLVERGTGVLGEPGMVDIGGSGTDGETPSQPITGNDLSDLWIRNWIKSRNFKPKSQGFLIDGKTGYIECMGLYVGGGTITGATIQTAEAPNPRVVIDGTNFIQTYDSNYLRVKIDTSSIKFYTEATGTLGATLYGETNLGQFGFNADSDYFSISSSINEDAVFYLLSPRYWGSVVMVESGAYEGELLLQASSSLITIQGNLLPLGDDFYTLGATGRRWMNIYLSGNINMEVGKTVDGVDISVHAGNADAHHAQSHAHSSHTGIGASDHHSSTSNALAITPSTVTSTGNYTFNTTANVGIRWDMSGQAAEFWFDNVTSDLFGMTHSLVIGTSAGKSIGFNGGATRMTGNATNFTFNQRLEPNGNGTLDLGAASYYWKDIYLTGNITVGGTVDGVDISVHVGNADAHHAQSHAHSSHTGIGASDHHSSTSNGLAITPSTVVSSGACNLAGITCNGTLQPNSTASLRYCGTSGSYWARVYSDAYFTKNTTFQTFDKYDDLQILRDLTFDKNDKLVLDNLPKEIHDKDFINFGGLASFNLCASKKIVECIDDLKKTIDILTNRLNKLENV